MTLPKFDKFSHPDLVGGVVWSSCEISWINKHIQQAYDAGKKDATPSITGANEMKDLVFALRNAAPDVEKEYCSPYGLLMDSAADALEAQAQEIAFMTEATKEKVGQ